MASGGHRFADVNLDNPNFESTDYDPWIVYARSETANVLFTVEFARRYRGRGVQATAVHPGAIRTVLARHVGEDVPNQMIENINKEKEAKREPFLL
ncbi:MAG: hypothetical protein ABII76_14405 [Pseudomonadota bacterium]